MSKYLIAALCCMAGPLLAGPHPEQGSWGVTGEYLYFKPSLDDTYFVIQSPSTTSVGGTTILAGQEKNNKFDFRSGYRVGVNYAFCDSESEMGVFYTHLDAKHTRTITGTFLSPTVGIENYTFDMANYAGSAYSKINAQYQRVDGLFAHKIYQCDGVDFRFVFGLEYANLDVSQHIGYLPTTVTSTVYSSVVRQKATTWGVGPEIGFDFDYDLCRLSECLPGGLSFHLFSSGSLLVGEPKGHTDFLYTSTTTSLPWDVSQERSTRIIPALHARVSLNYDFCLCNYSASIGAGYEFNSYIRSLVGLKNAAYYGLGLNDTQYSDYGVQGFFASASVQF